MPRLELFANLERHYLEAGANKHYTELMVDVAELHNAVGGTPRATRESAVRVSAWYLALNASALLAAIAAYESLSDAELSRLRGEHQELNIPGGILAWASKTLIQQARSWLALSLTGHDAAISFYGQDLDDDLNLLRRVLEYTKYQTAAESSTLLLSPVSDYLVYPER